MNDFNGKTVIVTGGIRGIGRAVCEMFLNRGATVVATYAGNHESAAAFLAEFSDKPLETIAFDVADYDQAEHFFEQFDEKHPVLDILINNAGIRRDNVLAMMPKSDWDAVLDTNLSGTFHMSKLAVMRMSRQRWGRIISVTSPSGRLGFAGQANYAAAKAGQVALTRSLCKEVARRNITVNCVSPGFTDTDLLADFSPEQRKEYQALVPMRRFAQPAEIAAAIAFLASDDADYITGQVLEISGGL